MVVGKKEKSDVKFQKRADLVIKGKKFTDLSVFGDSMSPDRRDIFLGDDVRESFSRLPANARATWMGKKYNAKLSFRFGLGGRRIPVYTFML